MRKATLVFALLTAACGTPRGQGKSQPNTPIATAGAREVGRSQGPRARSRSAGT